MFFMDAQQGALIFFDTKKEERVTKMLTETFAVTMVFQLFLLVMTLKNRNPKS